MFKMIIAGNLGRDAEIKEINGQLVMSFSIAVNQNYKDANGQTVERSTWISCSQWKEKAGKFGVAPWLKKGSKVVVEGTPSINTYKDQQNNFRADFRLRIEGITIMHSTAEKINGNVTPAEVKNLSTAASGDQPNIGPVDDLPF